jgi:hypothetical protein
MEKFGKGIASSISDKGLADLGGPNESMLMADCWLC